MVKTVCVERLNCFEEKVIALKDSKAAYSCKTWCLNFKMYVMFNVYVLMKSDVFAVFT